MVIAGSDRTRTRQWERGGVRSRAESFALGILMRIDCRRRRCEFSLWFALGAAPRSSPRPAGHRPLPPRKIAAFAASVRLSGGMQSIRPYISLTRNERFLSGPLSLSLFLSSSPRASSPQIKLSFQAAGTAPEYPSSQLTCDGGVVYWARHRHALPRTLGRPSKHRDNILSTISSELCGDTRYCTPSNLHSDS